jgi:hypothetical protein
MNRQRLLALGFLAGGLAALITLVVMAVSPDAPARPMLNAPLLGALALASVILLLLGRVAWRSGAASIDPEAADYRHTYLIFAAVAVLLVAGAAVRHLFVPTSFGMAGRHFRADALKDARRPTPRHLGQKACMACHEDVGQLHDKDAHARVACEACHGPAGAHAAAPDKVKPRKDKGRAACLVCHQYLDARPAAFPQIEVAAHYALVGVKDPSLDCTRCHSPHEPLFVDRDLRKARLHPLVQRCRDCHAGRNDENLPKPASHPAIFECSYCHEARVKDFATRKHRKQRCTTCHIFRQESAFAGRIVKDSDPRFCLLCHQKQPFRSEKAAPQIDPTKHVEGNPKPACLECHQDAIHGERPAPPAPAVPAPPAPPPGPAEKGMQP